MFKKVKEKVSKFCEKYFSFDLQLTPALVPIPVRSNYRKAGSPRK